MVGGRQFSLVPVQNSCNFHSGPRECARVTGLVKTVAHPRQDRRLLGVVTHPRPQRALCGDTSKVVTRQTWLWGRHRLGHQPVVLSCKEARAGNRCANPIHPSTEVCQKSAHGGASVVCRRMLSAKNHGLSCQKTASRNLSLIYSPRSEPFIYWRTNFRTEVCSGSNHPAESMPWIKEVEMANSVDDLNTSRSSFGRVHPNFKTVDARIASALKKYPEFELGRAKGSKRRPISPWQTDRVYDLRTLPGDGYSRDHPRFLLSDGCNFTWRRRARL